MRPVINFQQNWCSRIRGRRRWFTDGWFELLAVQWYYDDEFYSLSIGLMGFMVNVFLYFDGGSSE